MAQCVTCGAELHPERAEKYTYCMAPACQEKNAKGLTMVAIGMNKAADELVLLDERTRAELANGRYQDQRRGYFGAPIPGSPARNPAPRPAVAPDTSATPATPASKAVPSPTGAPASAPDPARGTGSPAATRSISSPPDRAKPRPSRPAPAARQAHRLPGTGSQQRLAVLHNQRGLQPAEIADKIGLTRYEVTQIILAAKNRGKA